MQSITIELNRPGGPEGVLRLYERYSRAISNDPIVEVSVGLKQKDFQLLMQKLRCERLRQGSPEEVRKEAATALADLIEPISDLLSIPENASDELRQVEVVTNARELVQLPFEVLEEHHSDIVLTRRVRRQGPRPPVVVKPTPKVLFVWAEPCKRDSTTRRRTVPHEAHRKLLEKVLEPWLRSTDPEETLVEVGNATFDRVKAVLQNPKHGFTHVHILVHGAYDDESEVVFLLLEDEESRASFHSHRDLESIYEDPDLPRPSTVILATPEGGEVDEYQAGGVLGQAFHEAGVPVVLASQLPLTRNGSSELIETFLARIIKGEDPRRALRACRDALRQREEETFYDRVALVGYVNPDVDAATLKPYHSVFISYSTADEEFCRKLTNSLANAGMRVWFASHDMRPGEKIHDQIYSAIEEYNKLLIVLSEASMKSEWVGTELYRALKREREEDIQMLFPVSLVPYEKVKAWNAFDSDTGRDMAREIREYFIPDFSEWRDESAYSREVERLIKALRVGFPEERRNESE